MMEVISTQHCGSTCISTGTGLPTRICSGEYPGESGIRGTCTLFSLNWSLRAARRELRTLDLIVIDK